MKALKQGLPYLFALFSIMPLLAQEKPSSFSYRFTPFTKEKVKPLVSEEYEDYVNTMENPTIKRVFNFYVEIPFGMFKEALTNADDGGGIPFLSEMANTFVNTGVSYHAKKIEDGMIQVNVGVDGDSLDARAERLYVDTTSVVSVAIYKGDGEVQKGPWWPGEGIAVIQYTESKGGTNIQIIGYLEATGYSNLIELVNPIFDFFGDPLIEKEQDMNDSAGVKIQRDLDAIADGLKSYNLYEQIDNAYVKGKLSEKSRDFFLKLANKYLKKE